MTTILVTGQFSAENIERMRQAAPGVDLRFVPKLNAEEDGLGDVEAIAGTINASHLAQSPRLKWVHSWAAGADNDLFPEMLNSPVILTSSTGNGAIPLAEHSMLLMLMLNRAAWIFSSTTCSATCRDNRCATSSTSSPGTEPNSRWQRH